MKCTESHSWWSISFQDSPLFPGIADFQTLNSPLNEPDIAVPYASMDANGQQTTDILEKLTPAVKKAGLDVKVTCCDWAGWENGREILKGIQETDGEQYLDVVSGHGYGQPLGEPYDTPLEVWQGEWAELSSKESFHCDRARLGSFHVPGSTDDNTRLTPEQVILTSHGIRSKETPKEPMAAERVSRGQIA